LLLCCTALAEKRLIRVGLGEGPFPGACVQVLRAGAETLFDLDNFVPDTLTDARGEAVIDLPDGARVLVYAPGHALAIATPRPGPVDIALRPERRLASRVIDAQGNGIANAEVLVRTTYREKATFRVRTKQDGTFHVFGLWLDDLSVSASAPGFLESEAVTVTAAEPLAPLRLDRPAAIDGKVIDEEDHAVAGIMVLVATRRVTTGADGSFRIAGLPPRTLPIALDAPYGAVPLSVDLADGENRTGVVVHALRPAQLSLRIVDAKGAPLPGAKVNGQRGTPTGAFLCPVVPEAMVILTIEAEGFATQRLSRDPMRCGTTADLGDIALTPWPSDLVRVFLPDGTPATEGVVHGTPIVEGVAEIRLQGRYGSVNISVPGYPTVSEFVYGDGETVVRLPEPRWLEGSVLGVDGEALAGAKVTALCSPDDVDALADADGHFRLGPLEGYQLTVTAAHPAYRSASIQFQLGEGPLEMRLFRASPPRTLEGFVRRAGDPVQDFTVMGRRILDEEGRFSVTLDDPDLEEISIGLEHGRYMFPLPPPGTPLIADLPGGSLRIELDAPEGSQQIDVRSLGYSSLGRVISGPDGVAVVEGVAPGRYWLEAWGYRRQSVDIGDAGSHTVRLLREAQAHLLLRTPWGEEEQHLGPDESSTEFEMSGDLLVELTGLRLTSGEQTVIDLRHARPASLTVIGPPAYEVSIRGVTPECEFSVRYHPDDSGLALYRALPPGRYVVESSRYRRVADIPAGESVEVVLRPDSRSVAGVVRFRDGRPAAGAEVHIDSESVVGDIVCDQQGRYAIDGPAEGHFTITASLPGFASARVEGLMTLQGLATQGPLDPVLDPALGAITTIVDPTGAPAAYVWLRVDRQRTLTDALGRCRLARLPAQLDLELEDFVAVRGLAILAHGTTIRLEPAAGICVLLRAGQPTPTLVARGREWPLRRIGGRASANDLPPGPAELRWGGEAPPDPLNILLREAEETLVTAPE